MNRFVLKIAFLANSVAACAFAQRPELPEFPFRNEGVEVAATAEFSDDQTDEIAVPVAKSGQPLFRLNGPVNAVAVSFDERYIAAVSQSGMLAIYDFQTGEMHSETKHDAGALHALAFHSDKNLVAYGGVGKSIEVQNLDSGHHVIVTGSTSGTTALAFAGENIVAGGRDGTVCFIAAPGRPPLFLRERHREQVLHVAAAQTRGSRKVPAGTTLIASVDESGLLRVWNNGEHLARKTGGRGGVRYANFVGHNLGRLFYYGGAPDYGNWLDVRLKDQYGTYCVKVPKLATETVYRKGGNRLRKVFKMKSECRSGYLRTIPVLEETSAGGGYEFADKLAISKDGYQLASAGTRSVEIWSLWDKSPKHSGSIAWPSDSSIQAIGWNTSATALMAGDSTGAVYLLRP
jgi:WD40 repeat protein